MKLGVRFILLFLQFEYFHNKMFLKREISRLFKVLLPVGFSNVPLKYCVSFMLQMYMPASTSRMHHSYLIL